MRGDDSLKDALKNACSVFQGWKGYETMKLEGSQFRFPGDLFHVLGVAIVCMALLALGSPVAWAQQGESQVMTTTEEAPKIPNESVRFSGCSDRSLSRPASGTGPGSFNLPVGGDPT